MQPNYEEMMKKQQQDYQRSRDPFEYGRQVAQRRYSEIMANIDSQRQGMQQSYGDLYQQARQRAVGKQAAGGPTLTGGMGQQQRDFISTAEMQQLGQIAQAREQAGRDLFTQAQSAFSNAQLEGQQATQMDVQNRQTELQLLQQRQAILDSDLPEEQKQAQLNALGGTGSSGPVQVAPRSFGQKFAGAALTTGTILGTGAATIAVGKGVVAGVSAAVLANSGIGTAAVGTLGLIKAGAAAGTGILGTFGGAVGAGLAAVPGWGWAVLAGIAGISLIAAAVT